MGKTYRHNKDDFEDYHSHKRDYRYEEDNGYDEENELEAMTEWNSSNKED